MFTRMRRVSNKQAAKNREIAKIKSRLPKICAICGRHATDYCHILPKSIWMEHYTNPLNGFMGCRTCHQLFDDNKAFRQLQTHLFEQALKVDERGAHRYFDM